MHRASDPGRIGFRSQLYQFLQLCYLGRLTCHFLVLSLSMKYTSQNFFVRFKLLQNISERLCAVLGEKKKKKENSRWATC